jgi:hypothetical protein
VAACREGRFYNRVVFVRPDVLLLRDIRFSDPRWAPHADVVHVNGGVGGNGDFHFVASSTAAVGLMERLPDEARNVMVAPNAWVQTVFSSRGFRFVTDGIAPGVDEEVYRKLPFKHSMKNRGFDYFHKMYGMTDAEWSWVHVGKQHGQHNSQC